ncbi:MAG: AraC family transcriptional regulator [Lachnospiraceae bacterium]|nr:AraC family transcriptional regulator [Lachnospiraceae bacterium]
MDYEIVTLQEKTVAGISARTNNGDPQMSVVIGGLWRSFFEEGIYQSIPDKTDGKALGIYMDYAGNEKDDYTIMVASETKAKEQNDQITVRKIPAGRYAKFIVRGDMHQAVAAAWKEIWSMDLPRTFVCDFEEYQDDKMEDAEIHIYIGLKAE